MIKMMSRGSRSFPAARAYSIVVSVGFFASGVGTLMGSTPTWPAASLWAIAAFVTAGFGVLYAIAPTALVLRMATSLVLTASALRSFGYFALGPTVASRLAGGAAWALVAIYAFRAHLAERTVHHDDGGN